MHWQVYCYRWPPIIYVSEFHPIFFSYISLCFNIRQLWSKYSSYFCSLDIWSRCYPAGSKYKTEQENVQNKENNFKKCINICLHKPPMQIKSWSNYKKGCKSIIIVIIIGGVSDFWRSCWYNNFTLQTRKKEKAWSCKRFIAQKRKKMVQPFQQR